MTRAAAGGKKVREVGEFPLITGIGRILGSSRVRSSGMILGAGDDTAVWQPRPGRTVAITVDTLVEDVHFRKRWAIANEIGQRALAVNLSDLAAMGARPRVAVVSLGLTGDEFDRWVYDLYRGMLVLAGRWHTRIVGGDIVHSPRKAGTTISITAHGELRPGHEMLRSQAQEGDIIAVTGPLGLAAGGVRLLTEDRQLAEGAPIMLAAHRTPQPRVLHGILLARAGVRCAMDISDGLLGDLPKICEASEVSALIVQDDLPIPNALRWSFPDDWLNLALRGGEDFELLFSAPPEVYERVLTLFGRCGLRPPTAIGKMTKPGKDDPAVIMRRPDLRREVVEAGAFDHFSPITPTPGTSPPTH